MKNMKFYATAFMTGLAAAVACSNPPDANYNKEEGTGGTGNTGNTSTGGSKSTTGGGSSTGGSTNPGSGGSNPGSGGSTNPSGGSNPGTGGTTTLDPSKFPKYDGFTLVMAEEFDRQIDLANDPVWTYSDGGLGEGSVRFVKEAISFADGKMRLTATDDFIQGSDSWAESYAGDPAAKPPRPTQYPGNVIEKDLRSGELRTKFNNYRYGRYEVSLKAPSPKKADPNVNGNYISTLFVFRTPKDQQWREIDIEVTGDSPGALTTNLLYANKTAAWNERIAEVVSAFPNGPGASGLPAGFNARTGFNTYAFEWTPDAIRWFVNGTLVRVREKGANPFGVAIPEASAKIVMNLWIFGPGADFGGKQRANNDYKDGNFFAEYEWIRFYKWNNEDKYPCSPTPDCLPDEDKDFSKNNTEDGI